MASQSPENQQAVPEATSPGNEGARGSRGEANSGAQEGDSTNQGARERPQTPRGPDLRKSDGQGGGGLASDSSRSYEIDEKGRLDEQDRPSDD